MPGHLQVCATPAPPKEPAIKSDEDEGLKTASLLIRAELPSAAQGDWDASADVSASMAAPVLLGLRARERCRVAF